MECCVFLSLLNTNWIKMSPVFVCIFVIIFSGYLICAFFVFEHHRAEKIYQMCFFFFKWLYNTCRICISRIWWEYFFFIFFVWLKKGYWCTHMYGPLSSLRKEYDWREAEKEKKRLMLISLFLSGIRKKGNKRAKTHIKSFNVIAFTRFFLFFSCSTHEIFIFEIDPKKIHHQTTRVSILGNEMFMASLLLISTIVQIFCSILSGSTHSHSFFAAQIFLHNFSPSPFWHSITFSFYFSLLRILAIWMAKCILEIVYIFLWFLLKLSSVGIDLS